jgi:ATP-dependent RNA helicase DDX27
MEANKGQNLLTHHDEIMSRPKKTWFQTQSEKEQSKENSLKAYLNSAPSDDVDLGTVPQGQEEEVVSWTGKRKRDVDDYGDDTEEGNDDENGAEDDEEEEDDDDEEGDDKNKLSKREKKRQRQRELEKKAREKKIPRRKRRKMEALENEKEAGGGEVEGYRKRQQLAVRHAKAQLRQVAQSGRLVRPDKVLGMGIPPKLSALFLS